MLPHEICPPPFPLSLQDQDFIADLVLGFSCQSLELIMRMLLYANKKVRNELLFLITKIMSHLPQSHSGRKTLVPWLLVCPHHAG